MIPQDVIYAAVICLTLTLISCWMGDDDIIYTFIKRKPTSKELIVRARYVIIKFMASLYGGGVLSIFLADHYIKNVFHLIFTRTECALFLWVNVVFFSFFIGLLQNVIRFITGRKRRPIVDLGVWQYSIRQGKK